MAAYFRRAAPAAESFCRCCAREELWDWQKASSTSGGVWCRSLRTSRGVLSIDIVAGTIIKLAVMDTKNIDKMRERYSSLFGEEPAPPRAMESIEGALKITFA